MRSGRRAAGTAASEVLQRDRRAAGRSRARCMRRAGHRDATISILRQRSATSWHSAFMAGLRHCARLRPRQQSTVMRGSFTFDAAAARCPARMMVALDGGRITLSNLAVALKQLHRGASAPYSCGAGGGYFSVSAEGRWYAPAIAPLARPTTNWATMKGFDAQNRRTFLAQRSRARPDRLPACWARYLLRRLSSRSRDPQRGVLWLHSRLARFRLVAYCDVLDARPDYFNPEQAVPAQELSA